ncbi:hypothetical protein D3C72_1625620 [compost metagenome]
MALILQQAAGQHRGVVLQRDGVGQLPRVRQDLAQQIQQFCYKVVELACRQARIVEQPVIEDVLARVHGFLADEARHGAFQRRVGELVAVVAHAVHEEALAGREEDRQRVDEMGDVGAALVPVADAGWREVRMHVATDWHHDVSSLVADGTPAASRNGRRSAATRCGSSSIGIWPRPA